MTRGALGLIALIASTAVANASAVDDHLGFDPVVHPELAESMYVAPANILIHRLRQPDGSSREFEFDYSRPGHLRSRFGWSGKLLKGGGLRLESGEKPFGKLSYVFDTGRLTSLSVGGKRTSFGRKSIPRLPEEQSPMLASGKPPELSAEVKKEMDSKWTRSGRLQFPWGNPNRNALLYAELLLAVVALAFAVSSRKMKIALAVPAVALLVAVLMAGSRGALLGLILGVLVFAVSRGRELRVWLTSSRRAKVIVLLALAAFAVLALALSPRLLTRGFGAGNRGWSNKVRVEIWQNAPRMLVDAPGGWGTTGQAAGLAYMDWYQPLQVVCLTSSLINDHLTTLVGHGWAGRIGYLFLWMAALALGVVLLVKRRSAYALAVLILLGTSAWFNPVLSERTLLVLPAMAVVPLLAARPWRNPKPYLLAVAVAAVSVAALAEGLYLYGTSVRIADSIPVRREDNRTLIKGLHPRVWAVDDLGEPMGGVLACKGIRAHYLNNPHSAALGYVRSIDDLPASVDRLVLGGRSGDEWLRAVCSDAKRREHLPLEVIFLSPPFPPSAVPPILKTACTVYYVTGEFVTWYHPKEFEAPGDWVKVIPGAELYIPGWVEMVTAGVQ